MQIHSFNQSLNKLCLFVISFACLVFSCTSNSDSEALKFKLSARNLPNSDIDGPSDPYTMVFTGLRRPGNSLRHWHYYGSTGTKVDTLNPEWDETFQYQYINGSDQWWHFIVMDRDESWFNPIYAIDDPLGHIEVRVEDYVRELRANRQQRQQRNDTSPSPIQSIQKYLTFPLGGVIHITPIDE